MSSDTVIPDSVSADSVTPDSVTPPAVRDHPTPAGSPPEQRRLRLRTVTSEEIWSILGAFTGSLGLVWTIYERILPLSGALGFWLTEYVVFLICYGLIGWSQWSLRTVIDRLVQVVLAS